MSLEYWGKEGEASSSSTHPQTLPNPAATVGWSHPHQGLTLSLASTHSDRAALSSLSPFRSSGPHGSSERHRHPHFADAASAVLCSLFPREGSTAVGIETAVPPLQALAEPRV